MKLNVKSSKMSLKVKLSLMFFIFITIPLIILGSISYYMAAKSMQSSTEQQMRELTAKTAQSINQTVSSVKTSVQIMSENEDLARAATGDVIFNAEAFKYIAKIQKEHSGEIAAVLITDASGKAIISNEKEKYDLNLSDREYVQKTLKGTPTQSEVLISKLDNKPIVSIAYPLLIEDKVVGVLIADIKFEDISMQAAKLKIGQKGYAYMIDKNGLTVYHPNSEKVLKEKTGDTNNAKLKALEDDMKAGKTSSGEYTYEGSHKFLSFAPAGSWSLAVTADYNEYMAPAIKIRQSTILITLLAILCSVGLAYLYTTKRIVKPILKLEELMGKAGDGDLTVKANITTGDEIETLGDCFNQMIEAQSHIIHNVRKGADDLAASSEEVSASAEEISASTQEITVSMEEVATNSEKQNHSIVETSKVLVELSSLVQIAQNKANTTKDNSNNTMAVAKQGRIKVQETVQAIDNINKAAEDTAVIFKVLNELSLKISGIISTISNISSQTNLLALNAAIEAARAGEHGKGFTVVADEVRKLSEQTNSESNEITLLVNEMVVQINKAVSSIDSSKQAVDSGVIIVKETDTSFLSIIDAVEQIAQDIEQIVDITKDEVASSEQIIKLIDSVATIAETNTANTEEVATAAEQQSAAVETLAASSEQTSAMATNLDNLVEKFII